MAAAQREFWVGLVGDSQELFEQLGGTVEDTDIRGVKMQRFQQENGLTLCFYHFFVQPNVEVSALLAGHFMKQNMVIFCVKNQSIVFEAQGAFTLWAQPSYQSWLNVLLGDDFKDRLPLVIPAVVAHDLEERYVDLSHIRLAFLSRCLQGINLVDPYSSPSKFPGAATPGKDEKKGVVNMSPAKLSQLNAQVQTCRVFAPGENKSLFIAIAEHTAALYPTEIVTPEIIPEAEQVQCDELTQGKNAEDAATALFNNYILLLDYFIYPAWWRPHCAEVAQALKTHVDAVAPKKCHDTGYTDPLEQFIATLKKINEEPKSSLLARYIQYYETKFLVPRRGASSTDNFFKKQSQYRGRALSFDFDERRAPSPTPSCSFGPFGRRN